MFSKTVDIDHLYVVTKYKILGVLIYKKKARRGYK